MLATSSRTPPLSVACACCFCNAQDACVQISAERRHRATLTPAPEPCPSAYKEHCWCLCKQTSRRDDAFGLVAAGKISRAHDVTAWPSLAARMAGVLTTHRQMSKVASLQLYTICCVPSDLSLFFGSGKVVGRKMVLERSLVHQVQE